MQMGGMVNLGPGDWIRRISGLVPIIRILTGGFDGADLD